MQYSQKILCLIIKHITPAVHAVSEDSIFFWNSKFACAWSLKKMVSANVIKVYVEKTKKRHIARSGDSRDIDSYDPLYRMLYICIWQVIWQPGISKGLNKGETVLWEFLVYYLDRAIGLYGPEASEWTAPDSLSLNDMRYGHEPWHRDMRVTWDMITWQCDIVYPIFVMWHQNPPSHQRSASKQWSESSMVSPSLLKIICSHYGGDK